MEKSAAAKAALEATRMGRVLPTHTADDRALIDAEDALERALVVMIRLSNPRGSDYLPTKRVCSLVASLEYWSRVLHANKQAKTTCDC
jgi:hypothetical protein